jgi:hypothetical protein
MDLSEEIAILERDRQAAVAAFDLTRARELSGYIATLRSNSRQLSDATVRTPPKSRFEAERDSALNDFRAKSAEFTRLLYQLRATHAAELAKVRRSHSEEIEKLAQALAKELELCSVRSIPRVTRLRREAQVHALSDNVALADALAKEADEHEAEVQEERIRAVHALYTERQRQVLEKHRAFEASFESKLRGDTEHLKTQFRSALSFYKQRVATQAVRFGVEISEEEIAALFEPYKLKDADQEGAVSPARPRTAVSPRLFNPKFRLPEQPKREFTK